MEIGDLKTRQQHEDGIEVQIKSPTTGEPLDFHITVMGPDSKEWRRAQKDDLKAYVAKGRDGGFSADELVERDIQKIVQITTGWRGLTDGGKEVPFTKEACRDLYVDAPYVMDQVDLAAGQFRDFIKG